MSENEVKFIDLTEFRDAGYLQEINRLFLHGLGLALDLAVDEGGAVTGITGIRDMREEPAGEIFAPTRSVEDLDEICRKENFVQSERRRRNEQRKRLFGFNVQPPNAMVEVPPDAATLKALRILQAQRAGAKASDAGAA